jgi:putative transposase
MAGCYRRTISEAISAFELTCSEPSYGRELHPSPKGLPVRNSRYSDAQIEGAVHQAEAGALVADIVRELGISEATLYAWKKRIDGLGTPEIRQLRGENAQLNQVVDDLTRDRQVCNTCSFEKTPISNAFQLDESISDSEHTRRKTAHST